MQVVSAVLSERKFATDDFHTVGPCKKSATGDFHTVSP